MDNGVEYWDSGFTIRHIEGGKNITLSLRDHILGEYELITDKFTLYSFDGSTVFRYKVGHKVVERSVERPEFEKADRVFRKYFELMDVKGVYSAWRRERRMVGGEQGKNKDEKERVGHLGEISFDI